MNELFGKYNRPKAEIKYIEKYINLFEKGKIEYKSKNYLQALGLLNQSYELLSEIWDEYPKIITLYLIMKTKCYLKQYEECEIIKEQLNNIIPSIYKEKRDKYFKIKITIFLYDLIINFIKDDLDKSIESIINLITYISTEEEMTLEEKISYFWKYINNLLKICGKTNSSKYEILKENYNSMLYMDAKIIEDEFQKIIPVKKIKKSMLDEYKFFFNFKLRQSMYEYLDQEFYTYKYGKSNDKVMIFLQKNMETYVRNNNKEKLIENFDIFLMLSRINLKEEFGLNQREIIFEQKRRISAFDTIFYNIVGAFKSIFGDYLEENQSDIKSKKNKIKNKNQESDWNEILTEMNLKNSIEDMKIKELKKIEEKKNNDKYDFIKDIDIPQNTEEFDKIILTNLRNKYKYNQSNIKSHVIPSDNYNFSKVDVGNNYNKSFNFFTKNNNKTNILTKTNVKIPKLKQKSKLKKEDFILRNINNFLINKIISLFTPIFKIQNGIQQDPITEVVYTPILPKKSDLLNLHYPNIIKSYYGSSKSGANNSENQDTFFYYDNFMLIKNCILFGVCDGHGKQGGVISHLISALFPSYIFYLILDDNSIRRKQDTNELMIKLFKLKESPEYAKKLHIFRYILNKLGVEYRFIPFISGDEISIFNLLYESIHLCHKALSEKYNIDIEYSGTTLCSGIIVGNKLYISNIGDSTVIFGVFNNKGNRWKPKILSKNHIPESPEENKRIMQYNGKIEKMKTINGEEYGPFRVFEKDSDLVPGLAMTRSIGDEKAKKIGVTYEPEIFVYSINPENKIIIIGTDGLWNNLSYDEAVQIAGKAYYDGKKVDECVNNILEIARYNWMEKVKKMRKEKKKLIANNKNNNNNNKNIEIKNFNMTMDDITCLVIFLNP